MLAHSARGAQPSVDHDSAGPLASDLQHSAIEAGIALADVPASRIAHHEPPVLGALDDRGIRTETTVAAAQLGFGGSAELRPFAPTAD